MVERRTLDRKVASSNPGRSGQRIFFSRVSFVCSLLLGVRSNPMLPAVTRKRSRSFCQKCRWQVTSNHAYTLDPTKSEWADYAALQGYCRNLPGNELTCNLLGNIRPESFQLDEPLWTDSAINSGISARELIFISKQKQKKRRRGMNGGTFSEKPRR